MEASAAPRWRLWAARAAIVVAAIVAFQGWQLRPRDFGPAPEISGRHIDGSAFALANWRKQHPDQASLVYFWAEWCPDCRTTAGIVTKVSAAWPVTTVAIQSGPDAAVATTMRERGYAWPTLADPRGDILRQYHQPGTPAFAIVDPDGRIRYQWAGQASEPGLRLRLWLASHA